MQRINYLFILIFALIVRPFAASAETIFESGTLGPTGFTWADLENQTPQGTNVNSAVFTGVRFQLANPVLTTQVGGHFVQRFAGSTFFGALVKLDGPDDF